ncbi:hypothetical protein P872_10850 [Rhodonellum psychrophilum GCM71 = DSM 17998]|uniref:TraB/GumN family protein n=2 Tax=Rhodonellum TaxID=336827 RepID=U5BKF8_9BACT|nr:MULTISPECIES: TraB/GumN family protein [Rhodonellum]ERM80940.1 hypothetical protein P872_10850 [Rhodonellum psychrophilum GCM71 = DSM 17998]SDY82820.1 hypothetical protein SAMN05444412_10357 [Rhodonellum ikkaensis]
MRITLQKSLFISVFFLGFIHQGFTLGTEEKSLLWKISGKNLKQDSYLFGTIHVICEDDFFMDARIENALKESEKLVLEIDLGDPNMMMEMQKTSMNPGMKNISKEMEPEQIVALDKFLLEAYGAGLDQFGIFKPFVLSSMVMLKMLPCTAQSSYEMYFMDKAKEQEMSIKGLETVGFQMGIFDNIPRKLQVDELAKMVVDENGMEEFGELTQKYLEQDLDGLYGIITDNGVFQEFGDQLLTDRNKNWIPLIENHIEEGSTFIAVGAGHLPSETGVISLLRKAGYTVEAVN